MLPITRRSNLLLFIIWLSYFSSNCHAILNSAYATHNCNTYTAIGAAQVCCNGDCADGATVDSPSGLCQNWLSPLYDPRNVLACSSTQLWSFTTSTSVTTGGTCATGCQWESEQNTYTCCECPSGYLSDTTNYDQSIQTDPIRYDLCFGCTDAGESLSYAPTTNTYSCQVPSQAPTKTQARLQARLQVRPQVRPQARSRHCKSFVAQHPIWKFTHSIRKFGFIAWSCMSDNKLSKGHHKTSH